MSATRFRDRHPGQHWLFLARGRRRAGIASWVSVVIRLAAWLYSHHPGQHDDRHRDRRGAKHTPVGDSARQRPPAAAAGQALVYTPLAGFAYALLGTAVPGLRASHSCRERLEGIGRQALGQPVYASAR